MVLSNIRTVPSASSAEKGDEKWIENIRKLSEQIEKLSVVDEWLAHGTVW